MASTLWKGHLSFGLVSIPIKLVRAARAEKVHMHNVHRQTGSRVRQVFVPTAAEEPAVPASAEPEPPARPSTVVPFTRQREPVREAALSIAPPPAPLPRGVPKEDLVRAFEYEKDKYVTFAPEELQNIAPRNSTTMEIVEFVNLEQVDPVYFENSYYVLPDKNGEKPYALLYEALRRKKASALAEVVMYRRDQTILIRTGERGLIAHTLFHEDEVRRSEEFRTDRDLAKPAEIEMAIKLVDALEAKFDTSKFKDKYRERLQQAIAVKLSSGEVTEAPPTAPAEPVADIMSALKASLEQMKKPAARESGATKTARATKKRTANQ